MALDRHLCSPHQPPPPKSNIILNTGSKDSFRTSCTALYSNYCRLLILDSPKYPLFRCVSWVMHGTLGVTPYQSLLHYLILFPMQTSHPSRNHTISLSYPSYFHNPSLVHISPLPHYPHHSTHYPVISCTISFSFLLSILIISLRRSPCYTSEQRLLPVRNVQQLITSTVSYNVAPPPSNVFPFFRFLILRLVVRFV